MHIRRFTLSIALAVVAVLLLAPAALAGAAGSAAGLLDWTALQFTAADGAAQDNFGEAVTIDGDTAVVGSPSKTVGANAYQGVAYVYTRAGGQWTLETTIIADDGAVDDRFGAAVSLDDDTIAIGAPGAGDVGAVYLYTRAGEGWGQIGKLSSSATSVSDGGAVGQMADEYGSSVSLRGRVLAVGAPGAGEHGAVYVYAWASETGVWSLWATLQPGAVSGSQVSVGDVARQLFGYAVSLDADGDTVLAVGAPGFLDDMGAVYLFDAPSDVWALRQTLTETEAAGAAVGGSAQSSGFGFDVSLKGDVLAVGAPLIAVGMPAAAAAVDAVGVDVSGAAYMYHRNDDGFSRVGTLTSGNPGVYDGFGAAVAIAGDLTVLVGAPGATVGGNEFQGVVYGYDWTGQIYQEPSVLVASGGAAGDWLGFSVAVSEGQVLAGAPLASIGENANQGAAWLFTLPGPTAKVSGWKAGWRHKARRLQFAGVAASGGTAVDYTQYRLNNGAWKTESRVTVTRQGLTRVHYRAVDIFGTIGEARTCAVRYDSKRPTVLAKRATAAAGTIARITYKVRDPRPGCGRATVRLVVKNAAGTVVTRSATRPARTNAWHKVRFKALRLTPGTYRVLLHAVDRAGNAQRDWTKATLVVK